VTPFLGGFVDELAKHASALGALKRVGGFAVKNPLLALGGTATLVGTGLAARGGYREGLAGGEKPRYLHATKDSPSRAALINWNKKKRKKNVSRHYDEKKFKRS